MNVAALSLSWWPFKMNQFQFLRSVSNLPDGSSTIPNCWTNDGMLSSSKRTHSTFFWDVRDFRTKNVCTGKTQWLDRETPVYELYYVEHVHELTPGGSLCSMCRAVAGLIDSWSQTGTVSRRRSRTLMLLRDPRPLWCPRTFLTEDCVGSGKS